MDKTAFPGPVRLSLVIPCFNEEKTLETCVNRVLNIQDDQLKVEIIIVDDASTDRSGAIAAALALDHPEVVAWRKPVNQGKGAALRTGFERATGEFVAVQDGDLEYDPGDLRKLLGPLMEGRADVVFGSRFLTPQPRRAIYFRHFWMNRWLTFLSNLFTDLNLTDMETCYKVFRREAIQDIKIQENRFGFEPEITAKFAQKGFEIYEVGISYSPRTYNEG